MLQWNQFTKAHSELMAEMVGKLEKSNSSLQKQLGYSPIESIKCRIKSEQSARKKLEKKGLPFDEKNLAKETDLAGIRVICKFLDDIPEIVGLVRGWEKLKLINEKDKFSYEQITIVEEQDFVARPKESGYRSYHLVCRKNNLFFEIQIRTAAMDAWASAEHMLKYKYGGQIPDGVKHKLKGIADISATLDMAMNDVRQDVKVGTAKERILEQLYSAIHLLEETGLAFKAEKYRERLARAKDDLDALKSLAIEAKEDVPAQYWKK